MKYFSSVFTFLLLILPEGGYSQVQQQTMKKSDNVTFRKNAAGPTFRISGRVTVTSSYCGGMEPSHEVLMEYSTPQPYTGKKFYLKKGIVNDLSKPVMDSIIVDDRGEFSLRLPKGVYSIILSEQADSAYYKNVKRLLGRDLIVSDPDCLSRWLTSPYFTFEITEKEPAPFEFRFHRACFTPEFIPCLQYIGPMPP